MTYKAYNPKVAYILHVAYIAEQLSVISFLMVVSVIPENVHVVKEDSKLDRTSH